MASVVLPSRAGSQNVRKGAPLLLLIAGLIIALAVLPSALNLPQTNPSTTLEYAPVPPEDNETPPPVGNFDSFGLGQSSSIESGIADGSIGGGDAPRPTNSPGKNTSTKRCVQTPKGPKQTEDPLAPPCVPDYNCKDNGGATYQGVTANEIRLLFYFDSGIVDIQTSRGDESRPSNKLYDLFKEQEPDEHIYARLIRGWAKYFEDRYQLYCRKPHFFVYYGSRGDDGPEAKRADAAQNFKEVQPFAVISDSLASNDAYLEAMARRGVLNFGSFIGREESFYKRFPKLVWGYSPTLETQAAQYTDYFCKQIKPYPATFAGGDLQGKKRRYGIVYTNDPNQPQLTKLKDLVKKNIETQCKIEQPGGIPEAPWKPCCFAEDNLTGNQYASEAMAKFSDPGQAGGAVTTIIWPGGIESKFTDAAVQRNYLPEWIQLGDGSTDGYVPTQYQNPIAFNGHAWVVSYQTKQVDRAQERCFSAYKDADPRAPDTDVRGRACALYERLRQLFTGIQVAGPKLGPTSVDKGYHAIPKIASEDPATPACFYNVDDYSCVKDGVAMWWDANAVAPNNSNPGCWRMPNGAKRYIVGQFPSQETQTMKGPN
ncbi:MAG: hypothetical protein H0U92_05580, partial [Actinobacteria bacterium]|nr:hypothetical protein [Actinomycetota bacterium]